MEIRFVPVCPFAFEICGCEVGLPKNTLFKYIMAFVEATIISLIIGCDLGHWTAELFGD